MIAVRVFGLSDYENFVTNWKTDKLFQKSPASKKLLSDTFEGGLKQVILRNYAYQNGNTWIFFAFNALLRLWKLGREKSSTFPLTQYSKSNKLPIETLLEEFNSLVMKKYEFEHEHLQKIAFFAIFFFGTPTQKVQDFLISYSS